MSNNDLGFAWMGFGKLNNIHIYKVTVLPYDPLENQRLYNWLGFLPPTSLSGVWRTLRA